MANEQLTIGQDKARLSVIGKSWPDMNFDSGLGFDLSQIIFDTLIDLGLDLPDIDFDDLDDITVIIGIDPDTEIVTLEYPDPDFDPDIDPDIDPDDLPDILDYPLPDLDWDDFIDNLEDLGIDPNTLTDLSFTGLDDLGIPTLVSLDEDFNIQMDELPASIVIVTPPYKMEYYDGERIDLTGMVVTAKKADGSTWTSAKYPNGHIPLGELRIDPLVATVEEAIKRRIYPSLNVLSADGYNTVHRNAWNTQYYNSALQIGVVPSGWPGWPAGSPLYAGSSSPFSSTIVLTAYQGHWYAMAYPSPVGAFMILCPAIHGYRGTVPLNWADFGSIGWAGNMIPESSENPLGAEYYEALCQEITVTWARYGDRKELTAGFTIQVELLAGGNGGR
jgi:hypothetical protein